MSGIIDPNSGLKVGGVFTFEQYRNGELIDTWDSKNTVVNEGLDYLLDTALSGGTADSAWHVGLIADNVTPVAGDTAASHGFAEVTSTYDETTRPAWTEAGVSSQSITNSASKATFTFNTGDTIYGAFLISDNTKGGSTGTLFAASLFSASRTVAASDQLLITYTVSAADA